VESRARQLGGFQDWRPPRRLSREMAKEELRRIIETSATVSYLDDKLRDDV
jgi:hypothetical protein